MKLGLFLSSAKATLFDILQNTNQFSVLFGTSTSKVRMRQRKSNEDSKDTKWLQHKLHQIQPIVTPWDAITMLAKFDVSSVPIVDGQKLVGAFSDVDLRVSNIL